MSQQKIRLDLRGVVVSKVGDDHRSIANASRRFLDRPAEELESKVQNVFVGHLLRRSAGSMTVEEIPATRRGSPSSSATAGVRK